MWLEVRLSLLDPQTRASLADLPKCPGSEHSCASRPHTHRDLIHMSDVSLPASATTPYPPQGSLLQVPIPEAQACGYDPSAPEMALGRQMPSSRCNNISWCLLLNIYILTASGPSE